MTALALRPPRMRVAIAVAAVVYLLAHMIAQCGVVFAHGHDGETLHPSSSSALLLEQEDPEHAHIDEGSTHAAHEEHTVVAMPRSDNPLRALTEAAVVAMTLAVILVVATAPRIPRGPPGLPVPVRRGRTILGELCINRC